MSQVVKLGIDDENDHHLQGADICLMEMVDFA